jgi:hypothetical protein
MGAPRPRNTEKATLVNTMDRFNGFDGRSHRPPADSAA